MDEAEIKIQGGHGGAGLVSFGKMKKSGPDGGNGGRGGDFYVTASSNLTLLNQFSRETEFAGEDGQPGGKNKKTGKNGKDYELFLPVGTSLIDVKTGKTILELTTVGETHLLCTGGKGGRGNWEFRSSRHTTPMISQPGLPGEEMELKVILKLIADFGLIGLPNAGKSSLLNELTNAQVKTANYPFTTLSPNLAVYKDKIIADIPGLIEGASKGRGLGISFLKHIEKTKVLLHCIASDTENPLKDYKTVREEMGAYNKELLEKKEVILLTKSDLVDKSVISNLSKKLQKKSGKVLAVSIHDLESIENLEKVIS